MQQRDPDRLTGNHDCVARAGEAAVPRRRARRRSRVVRSGCLRTVHSAEVGCRSVTEHKSRSTADSSGLPVRSRISSMPIARAPLLAELRETPPTLSADCRFARLFSTRLQSPLLGSGETRGSGLLGGLGTCFGVCPVTSTRRRSGLLCSRTGSANSVCGRGGWWTWVVLSRGGGLRRRLGS
jgi:hypothetical protein